MILQMITELTEQVTELMNRSRPIPEPVSTAGEDPTQETEPEEVQSLFERICGRLKGWLADLWRTVWRLIGSMTKPKEWSVKFKAGVTDLEIKFGA